MCRVITAADGADALLKAVDNPPDLIISDFSMPGLDGRQLYEKLRGREATRNIPFIFVASRGDIEEKLRPLVAARGFSAQAVFRGRTWCALAKKFVDRLHLEKMQQRAARPGVIQGRLEEMGVTELMQSLEMGQKSCRLTLRHGDAELRILFRGRPMQGRAPGRTRRRSRSSSKRSAGRDGEFEIDFGAASDRTTTTRSTTGLLMEAMRLMDEATATAWKAERGCAWP